MTRAQELADTFEAALAAHVPASQTAEWEGWEAYLGLVALAEAGERARGPFTVSLRYEDGGSLRWSHMYANAEGEIDLLVTADDYAALGEGS